VSFDRVGPSSDVYKRRLVALEFSFSRPTLIHKRRRISVQWLWWPRLPDLDARWLLDPEAAAALPRRASGGDPGTLRRARGGRLPRRAGSDGAAQAARFERHHGKREVHATTVARDILRSNVVRAARVMTSIRSRVLDGVLRRLSPPIRVISFDYCVLCLTAYTINAKIVRFYT
jgi:hypothetical protein